VKGSSSRAWSPTARFAQPIGSLIFYQMVAGYSCWSRRCRRGWAVPDAAADLRRVAA